MSPQKQAAQIANARLSLGPRTEEGKARSSQNSTRHGLCSTKYLIAGKDRPEFDRHCNEMMEALAPQGPIETQLAESIVIDQFRLYRIKNLENEIFAQGALNSKDEFLAGAETWAARCKELALLTLYEQRINRTLTRNKLEFEAKQAARKAELSQTPQTERLAEAAPTATPAEPHSKTASAAAAPAPVGFVRSNIPAVHPAGPEPRLPAPHSSPSPGSLAPVEALEAPIAA